jgi:hypothetical protein
MAGYNPNEPRNRLGRWTTGLSEGLSRGFKAVKSVATFNTGDPGTDASLKIAAIKGAAGLGQAGLHIGAHHIANKAINKAYKDAGKIAQKQAKRGRPSKSSSSGPHDFLDLHQAAGYGTTAPKIPTHYNKNDEKGLKVNFYIGKVEKKRRPTFPQGYKKHFDPFEGI